MCVARSAFHCTKVSTRCVDFFPLAPNQKILALAHDAGPSDWVSMPCPAAHTAEHLELSSEGGDVLQKFVFGAQHLRNFSIGSSRGHQNSLCTHLLNNSLWLLQPI